VSPRIASIDAGESAAGSYVGSTINGPGRSTAPVFGSTSRTPAHAMRKASGVPVRRSAGSAGRVLFVRNVSQYQRRDLGDGRMLQQPAEWNFRADALTVAIIRIARTSCRPIEEVILHANLLPPSSDSTHRRFRVRVFPGREYASVTDVRRHLAGTPSDRPCRWSERHPLEHHQARDHHWREQQTHLSPMRRATTCVSSEHIGHDLRLAMPSGRTTAAAPPPRLLQQRASTSPSSIRKPRIFTWSSRRPRYSISHLAGTPEISER